MKIYKILFGMVLFFGETKAQSITITPTSAGTNTEGKLYYDNATHSFQFWNGTTFINLGNASGGSNWSVSGDNIYRKSLVGIDNDSPKTTLHVGYLDTNTGLYKGTIRAEQSIELPNTSYVAFGKNSPLEGTADRGRIGFALTGKNALTFVGPNNSPDGKDPQETLLFVGRQSSTFEGPVNILAGDNYDNLLTVENGVREVFKVTNDGVKISMNSVGHTGASLIKTDISPSLAKWGFDNTGAEMLGMVGQPIPRDSWEKINFVSTVFEQNNYDTYKSHELDITNLVDDNFKVHTEGIYLVDLTMNWNDPEIDLGGTGIRNGKLRIKLNDVVVREFNTDTYFREHCFIRAIPNQYLTIEVRHEHCQDPPFCILPGVTRYINNIRATVMKF
jgi:hypothetical protein